MFGGSEDRRSGLGEFLRCGCSGKCDVGKRYSESGGVKIGSLVESESELIFATSGEAS
jgi:hypothetical protein